MREDGDGGPECDFDRSGERVRHTAAHRKVGPKSDRYVLSLRRDRVSVVNTADKPRRRSAALHVLLKAIDLHDFRLGSRQVGTHMNLVPYRC
jgi:hypothetical protein